MKGYYDIVGDGGSNIVGQVTALREKRARNLAQVKHLLAVGSGKGGVGKSTLATQIAAGLAARGARVAIFDADLNGPTQARLAGLGLKPLLPTERGGLTLPRNAQGLGVVSLGSLVPEGDDVDFESVATGESHTWRATREFTAIEELLGTVEWGELDYLVFDLPPGADRAVQYAEFLGPAVSFVLVSIPSDVARGVVSRSIKALSRTPNRLLGYVENMAGYHCASCGEVRPLFPAPATDGFSIPRLGSIPFDPELAALCDRGEPVHARPDLPSAAAAGEVVDRIQASLEETP